jgi:hypothetical protein
VIQFKGGGSCHDEASCTNRDRDLMSSMPWMGPNRARQRLNGIFNPNPDVNPDFYNGNHVNMIYCSSDADALTRPIRPGSPKNEFDDGRSGQIAPTTRHSCMVTG